MFIKNLNRDVTENEYKCKLKPHLIVMNGYMENYIIPEVVAFYLATGFYNSCVYDESFIVHINTVLAGFFNYEIKNAGKLMNSVKNLLLVKYGLKIVGDKPLRLSKLWY